MALPIAALAGAAGGLKGAVGGVAAGSVSLVGSLDVGSIMRGLGGMKEGLGKVKGVAKESFGDIDRLLGPVKGLEKGLIGVAIATAAAGLAIAALSPQVAPVLARMKVDFDHLSRVLGQELKPIFETVGNAFRGFVEFMDSRGRGVMQGINNAFQSFWQVLEDIWNILDNLGVVDAALGFFEELTNLVAGFWDQIHLLLTGEKTMEDILQDFFKWTSGGLEMISAWFGFLVGSLWKFISEFDWGKFGEFIWNSILGMGQWGADSATAWAILGQSMGESFMGGFYQGVEGRAFSPQQAGVGSTRTALDAISYTNNEANYTQMTKNSNLGGG